jgi:hypothetical protein
MGSNILGKHVSFEKIMDDPRVSINRQTVRGLLKISHLY